MGRKYYITEVFCDDTYSGNQLATVVDTAGMSDAEMQKIARAFNFAETTFIMGGNLETGFDVRIFTPVSELPFAGHPTLGTAFVLRNVIHHMDTTRLVLNLGVGPIPVTVGEDGIFWMRQNPPVFRPAPERDAIAAGLGLETTDLDPIFAPEYVSTGLEFLMVPVRDLATLKRASWRGDAADPVFVFCAEGYREEYDVSARMFAGGLGVPEDPATGSANGCLAAYMVRHQYLGSPVVKALVAQGFEVNRPSSLYLDACRNGEDYEINVGGRVNLVAVGDWLLKGE